LLATWVAFFWLQAAMSIALSQESLNRILLLEVDFVLGALWAALSVGIALWHRYVRSIARNLASLVALHVPMFVLAAWVDTIVSRFAQAQLSGTKLVVPFLASAVYYADFDFVAYIAVVVVAETLLVRRALLERQRQAKRLEASLSRARLDYLEAQLQPHFLFNSLGAVSELAYDAPATAGRVVHQLTAIFRTALARKGDEVTLGEEIVGIEPYLDIQRIRFADWLTIDYQVDDAAVDCLLPRFVLQPLVENAIRHGLSGRRAAGKIDISAAIERDSLIVRVADNGIGLDAAPSAAGRGIGLANVRDRLAILYGDDDRLRLTSNATGGAIAELTIPARRRASQADKALATDDSGVIPIRDAELHGFKVPRLFQHPWAAIPLVWFLWGLLWTQQSVMYNMLRHRAQESWLDMIRTDMTSALIWALITPAILWLARRLPIRRDDLARPALVYLVASALAPLVHVALLPVLTQPDLGLASPTWHMTFVVDFIIFAILVAIGHRRVLRDWLRTREAATTALTAELAAAQARATKLQGIPQVLLQSLDGITETVRRDPALTERQLTRLADYLRLALESTDERGMTPEREHALASAVAALRDSGAYPLDLTLTA
jgi:two-component system, LytTR family, sensor kinase